MAETGYLVSALLTGLLLVSVWVLVSQLENWQRYNLSKAVRRRDAASLFDSPTAWIVGFLALVGVAGGGAVLLVSGASVTAAVGDWVAAAGAFGVLLLGFLLYGTYDSARNRGVHSAQAALLSAWLFGSLFVAGIAVKLLVSGG